MKVNQGENRQLYYVIITKALGEEKISCDEWK